MSGSAKPVQEPARADRQAAEAPARKVSGPLMAVAAPVLIVVAFLVGLFIRSTPPGPVPVVFKSGQVGGTPGLDYRQLVKASRSTLV